MCVLGRFSSIGSHEPLDIHGSGAEAARCWFIQTNSKLISADRPFKV